MNELEVFTSAIELTDAAARSKFLEEACGGRPEVRSRLDALIRNAADANGFLESPPDDLQATLGGQLAERVGSQIGPFTLTEQIGEGGMGLVFAAEQYLPIRRQVAVKLIKPGMDTRDVISRFEAERQALALMDHPNIARVLDVGATDSGRPYFVMELVKGVPITDYCDANRLTPRERLELFADVCHAVQHAHQKGIIHRDIKPTNVLVASHEGKPVVKVIDFGVAKAIGQSLTERTAYTTLTQLVGTPLYMSPEQAGMSSLDIDTRSDIYSLGVLLYELLTGTTPLDKERCKRVAFEEVRRILCEEEPETPSLRIRSLSSPHAQCVETQVSDTPHSSTTVESIAACRQMEPAKLTKLVRGEVDWIVMKALEKDRERRYQSAAAFAADIERYLCDEPVHACPPSAAYRFHKLARKNKVALISAAVITSSLLLGTVISTWQALRAIAAETEAKEQEEKAIAAAAAERAAKEAEVAQRKQAEKNFEAALDAVDRMLGHVNAEEFQDVPKVGPVRRRILQDAIAFYERIPLQRGLPADTRVRMAQTWLHIADLSGNLDAREQKSVALNAGITLTAQLLAENPGHPKYLAIMAKFQEDVFARSLHNFHDFQAAERAGRLKLDLYTQLNHQDPTEKAWIIMQAASLKDLSSALGWLGKRDDAIRHATRALELLDPNQPEHGLLCAETLHQLARLQSETGPGEFDELYRQSLVEFRKYLAREARPSKLAQPYGVKFFFSSEGEHRIFGNACHDIAAAFASRHPGEAEELFDESIAVWRKICIPTHHRCADFGHLVRVLLSQSRHLRHLASKPPSDEDRIQAPIRLAKAENLFQEAIATQRHAVTRFVVVESRYELVQMLQEESQYLLSQMAKADAGPVIETASRKLQADALVTEAIQLCRQLGAEFPDDSKFRDRLATLLKLQAYDPEALAALKRRADSLEKAGSFVEAEFAWREFHTVAEGQLGADHWETRHALQKIGIMLRHQNKFPEAEALLRQAQTAYDKWEPDAWATFYRKSCLGDFPLREGGELLSKDPAAAEQKFAEAESLMLAGYEGMKAREDKIPSDAKSRMYETIHRLIQLYQAWDKPAEAARWRAKLEAIEKEPSK